MNKKLTLCMLVLFGNAQHAYSMVCRNVEKNDGDVVSDTCSHKIGSDLIRIIKNKIPGNTLISVKSSKLPSWDGYLATTDPDELYEYSQGFRLSKNKLTRALGFALEMAAFNPNNETVCMYNLKTEEACCSY